MYSFTHREKLSKKGKFYIKEKFNLVWKLKSDHYLRSKIVQKIVNPVIPRQRIQ